MDFIEPEAPSMIVVARRYHFRATHHIPELPGYDRPHEHDYTVEVVAESAPVDYYDTDQLDAWWNYTIPHHDGADLNTIYKSTTVEHIAVELLGSARKVLGDVVLSVMVSEDDDDRWARAS